MATPRPVKPATLKANAARLRDAAARYSRDRDAAAKAEFLAAGRAALRIVLALLGGGGEVRVNRGGPAASGEAVLHTDRVYVCLYAGAFGDASRFYYRAVWGRDDYVGCGNRWYEYAAFAADPGAFVGELRRLNPRPGSVEALLRDPDYLTLLAAAEADRGAAGCAASDYAEEYLDASEWGRFRDALRERGAP